MNDETRENGSPENGPTFRNERPRFVVYCTDDDCDWEASVHGREQSATTAIGHGLRTGHDAHKERVEDGP